MKESRIESEVWEIGNNRGMTGPTLPSFSGATIGESCDYDDWMGDGCNGDPPMKTSKIVTIADIEDGPDMVSSTIAIVPKREHQDEILQLIACAPKLLTNCKLAARQLSRLLMYVNTTNAGSEISHRWPESLGEIGVSLHNVEKFLEEFDTE
jgi:hypothetical protein